MNKATNRNNWYPVPEGTLDGDPIDIALRFLDNSIADEQYRLDNPFPSDNENQLKAVEQLMSLFQQEKQQILNGDQQFTQQIAHRAMRQVEELNRGERSVIAGQAHLFEERLREVGHIWAVVVTDPVQE